MSEPEGSTAGQAFSSMEQGRQTSGNSGTEAEPVALLPAPAAEEAPRVPPSKVTKTPANTTTAAATAAARKPLARVDFTALGLHAAVFFLYALVTVLLLRPLSTNLTTLLPDQGDSLHNMWTWGDNINRLGASDRGLFDANIFYPEKHTAIFAELQVLHTLLFYPFFHIADAPVLGYNLLLLAAYVLSAFSVYLLALELSENRAAAFVAGAMFGFFAYRFQHPAHVQVVAFQWVVLPLYFLVRYLKRERVLDLRLFFAFFTLQVIGIGYSTVFLWLLTGGLLAIVVADRLLRKLPLERKHVLACGAAAGALVASLPFYWPYFAGAREGYERGFSEFKDFSVDLAMLFSTGPNNTMYGELTSGIRDFRGYSAISSMFPGFVTLILMGFAIRRLWRWKTEAPERRPSVLWLLGAGLFFFVMMLGPIIRLRGSDLVLSPSYFVYQYGLVFKSLRYVPNYVQPAALAACLLVAIALARTKVFAVPWRAAVVAGLLSLGIVVESATDIPTVKAPPYAESTPAVYRWLEKQARGPVLELPIPKVVSGTDSAWSDQFRYMFYSMYHRMPLINGVSGFFPASHRAALGRLQSFPSPAHARWLQEIGVRYVVVHTPPGAKTVTALKVYRGVEQVYRDPKAVVFTIPPSGEITGPEPGEEEFAAASMPKKDAELGFQLVGMNHPASGAVGGKVPITLTFVNAGKVGWRKAAQPATPDTVHIRLAIRNWVRESDGLVPKLPGSETAVHARAPLSQDAQPRGRVEIRLEAQLPYEPGSYQARVNLVDPGDKVFAQPDIIVPIIVK